MRTITFKGLRWVADGSFGSYYKMPRNRGVKVFFTYHTSKESVLDSQEYYDAREEFSLLKKVQKLRLSPKPYEVVLVKDNERYCVGIIMQHINRAKKRNINWYEGREKLLSKLEDAGVCHDDLHEGNIIPAKHGRGIRFYAVDFSPEFIEIDHWALKKYRKRK